MTYICKVCNKEYKTYQTLWNHNKKNHNSLVSHSKSFDSQSKPKVSNNYKCLYCENEYKHKQSKWKHEQKCKIKYNELLKLKETTKQKELELEYKKEEIILKREEAKILQLKLKLQQSEKVDNITLKKLNKMLLERHNRIQNSTVNSNNNTINIQNNIVNNYKLVGFGKENELNEVLTNRDKKMILNAKYCSLEKLIEIVHCGKYYQFKNIIITNMKDNYMYKYDENKGVFILSTKSDVINTLIDYRIYDLEVIYNELLQKNKVDDETKNCIEKFINKINYSDSKYMDLDGKEHENFKQYKISEIKILLFNNQDKITNDISLFLSTTET